MGLNKNFQSSGLSGNGSSNSVSYKLVYTDIIDNKLYLTNDRNQTTDMVDCTEIILPSVDKYTEIHLYFETKENLTLIFPKGEYEDVPMILAHKSYEFIFTYIEDYWVIHFIEYGDTETSNYYETYANYPIELNDENIDEEHPSYLIEIHGNTVEDKHLGELEGGQYLIELNVNDGSIEFGKGGRIE